MIDLDGLEDDPDFWDMSIDSDSPSEKYHLSARGGIEQFGEEKLGRVTMNQLPQGRYS